MKIESNKMKKHKEKYRLERIIRIQSAFHKIPDFWGLFKMVLARPPMPTTENTIRLDGSSINQLINLRLYETQCPPTSDSSMKRDAIWGSYHVSFIAPPLRLPCSMALKPYLSPLLQSLSESNHQHTHLYISGNLLNLPLELQDYQIDPKRLWANGPRCSEITLGRRIFSLSLWWECKKLRGVTRKNDAATLCHN